MCLNLNLSNWKNEKISEKVAKILEYRINIYDDQGMEI